jgi:hypothetical protein
MGDPVIVVNFFTISIWAVSLKIDGYRRIEKIHGMKIAPFYRYEK